MKLDRFLWDECLDVSSSYFMGGSAVYVEGLILPQRPACESGARSRIKSLCPFCVAFLP